MKPHKQDARAVGHDHVHAILLQAVIELADDRHGRRQGLLLRLLPGTSSASQGVGRGQRSIVGSMTNEKSQEVFPAWVVQVDVHTGNFGPKGFWNLIVRNVFEPNLVVVSNS